MLCGSLLHANVLSLMVSSFSRTMMQALELLQLAKSHTFGWSEEIKPLAIAIIKLRLSEGISNGVSESFSQ